MATQGGIVFQEKVSRLLRGQNGKPVLKPNRALVLKDAVANRKPKKGEASCITEMSVLMACWKQNNFVDSLCSNEINSFYMCVEKAQVCPCFCTFTHAWDHFLFDQNPANAEFNETCPCINCDSSSTEKLRMGMEKSVTIILES